jgi:hypothetical protein
MRRCLIRVQNGACTSNTAAPVNFPVRWARGSAVRARLLRLVLILVLASSMFARGEESAAGRWEGSVQVPGNNLRLIVDFEQRDRGVWIGSIIIPRFNVKGAALTDIAFNGSDATFTIKSALGSQRAEPAKFRGHFSGGNKMTGNFGLGGNTAPFTLEKIGPAQVELPQRSTPIAKELEGEWKGEYELFAYPRKVTIKLQNHGAEGATAEFVILGRKENKLPVDLVMQEGSLITIESHDTGLSFEGRAEKDKINGTVLQGPLEIPVVLHRAK